MSIVRVGLAETKKFAEGYDAIFGKRDAGATEQTKAKKAPGKTKKAAPRAKATAKAKKAKK